MSKNRIRLSESQLKNVIAKSVKKMLKEGYDDCDPEEGNCNAPYSEWESFLGGRQPIFEFEDGITYVDYDENSGCLVSGGVTNNGFHGDGEVEVPVEDGNFQGALEAVYEQLCGMHEPLDESKRRKPAGKKNRVRLSESQLKKVITEGVKQVLSELDWKTYANASNKMRQEKGDTGYWKERGEKFPNTINKAADGRIRADRLGQAAKDAFNRDYGYKHGDWIDDDYAEVGMGGDFGSTEEFGPHAAAKKHDGVASVKSFPHGVYTSERTPEEFFDGNPNSGDAVNAYNKAKDEIQNFKKGNYKYNKGEGWSLDESIRKAIKTVLHKS